MYLQYRYLPIFVVFLLINNVSFLFAKIRMFFGSDKKNKFRMS